MFSSKSHEPSASNLSPSLTALSPSNPKYTKHTLIPRLKSPALHQLSILLLPKISRNRNPIHALSTFAWNFHFPHPQFLNLHHHTPQNGGMSTHHRPLQFNPQINLSPLHHQPSPVPFSSFPILHFSQVTLANKPPEYTTEPPYHFPTLSYHHSSLQSPRHSSLRPIIPTWNTEQQTPAKCNIPI